MKTDSSVVLKIMGQRIKRRRKEMLLTQEDFAARLSLVRASLSNIERGAQNVGIERLVEIADILECDINDLLPRIR